MKVGDVVWVQTGNQHEEPGTVLKVGCERNDDDNEDEDEDEDDEEDESDAEDKVKILNDGILVKLNVSHFRGVYAPHDVRALHDEEEATKSTRANAGARSSRRLARSVVTPSPRSEIQVNSDDKDDEEEDKKPAAKRKRSSPEAQVSAENPEPSPEAHSSTEPTKTREKSLKEDLPAENKAEVTSPYFKKDPAAAPSSDEEITVRPTKATKAKAKPKTKAKPKVAPNTKPVAKKPTKQASKPSVARVAAEVPTGNENQSESGGDSDADSDIEKERPFTVEYAATGRATCRRCDQIISKGDLRISHVPLFRGKPGFRMYRHLHCALFSEDIHQAQDVGGWKKLEKQDYEALVLRVEESKMEMEAENEEIQPDELVQVSFQGEIRKSPPGLTAALLPFQVEGASWMYCQEVNVPDIRGGTLADEMGMGKTVETLALILDNRPMLQHSSPGAKHPPSSPDLEARMKEETLWKTSLAEWKHEMEMHNVPKKLLPKKMGGARAGTLVVCPVIALSQWKSEIEKFTETNTLTVGIYHGPNRAKEMPPETMQKYDIILTTYQVMEQDFRKMVSPNKVTCPNCGSKFKVDKLPVHLKYFCGDGAQRTEAQARQRRRTDRDGGSPSRGGGGGGGKGKGKGKGNTKKKPPMTKEAGTNSTTSKRKVVRVKSTAEFDSDSDLSVNTDVAETLTGGRPSRKAAISASKLMSSSVKDWGAAVPVISRKEVDQGDESSFSSSSDEDDSLVSPGDDGSSSSSSDEDDSLVSPGDDRSSLEDIMMSDMAKNKGKGTSATKKAKSSSGKKRDASEISAPDNKALDRAREKQRLALANAKASKKSGQSLGKKSKGKKKPKAMKKGKDKDKKFDSSSDDSSDDAVDPVDPMADIDMDELVKEAMAGSRFSVLHSFCWWRIVLDEAHMIKSRSSQTAASAFALSGNYRWCLSGTPLQNRVGELYSLIRFMRLDPMAHYFCRQKGCSCKSIHYRMESGKCLGCGHRSLSHFSYFNRHILNPIQRDGYSGDGRRAMFTLKNEVLDKCLLRRTKESRAADLNLPPRIVTIRTIRLHPIEEDFYNALYTQTRSSFDDYVAEGTLLNNYAHIFDLLTKMRQAVDHPYLIVYSQKNIDKRREQAANGSVEQVANGSVECDICHEPPTERVLSSCCGAGLCRSCVIEYLTGTGGENTPCPSCQTPFSIDLNQASVEDTVDDGILTIAPADKSNGADRSDSFAVPSLKELPHVATGSILRRINLAEYATSTKIEALVQELIEMRQKRPGSKALVFSQFVNMLDLIRWRLHSDPCLAKMGLGVRILHGGMNVKNRDQTLKDFREDNGCRVLLMSLKAGGVALNLTVASEVFLVDNWWNPAAEMQAIDRTHRLGQYRPIRAVRFIAEGTVEERVLQLQQKKQLVFDGTVGRDAGSLKMLTVNDMKALFT